ncbi:hypothetical protein chiPu_0018835 [Chiloscyllium punctatum]|uniref:Uncharacterized protein n=1 Tax=Chiloscyllium punctatum TaxID=137246 RepID=A0A401RPZ9_CHIPU|nr:hypothetical protein [Chiloscyllium punctatum]
MCHRDVGDVLARTSGGGGVRAGRETDAIRSPGRRSGERRRDRPDGGAAPAVAVKDRIGLALIQKNIGDDAPWQWFTKHTAPTAEIQVVYRQ